MFILEHRIANFPNYVTLTSSLTHHRIVNLGPTALQPLTSAILAYYSPYDVTYDVIGNPHYSASYPYVAVGLGLELGLQLSLGLP